MDNDANDVSLSPCVHYLYQEIWANHIVGFQKQLVNGRINNEWKRKLSKKNVIMEKRRWEWARLKLSQWRYKKDTLNKEKIYA